MPYCEITQGDKKWNEYRKPEGLMDMYYYMSLALSELEQGRKPDEHTMLDMTHSLAILKKHLADTCHDHDECRVCDQCQEIFSEGYCIEGGMAYYCTKECMLASGMTWEEFLELYDDGEGDSYWTQWEG